jgi:hypothetical protein
MEMDAEFYLSPELILLIIALAALLLALIILVILYVKYTNIKKTHNIKNKTWTRDESIAVNATMDTPNMVKTLSAVIDEPAIRNKPLSINELEMPNKPEDNVTEQLSHDSEVNAEGILLDLYRRYGYSIDPNLWPLETARWHELVYCLLISSVEPEIPPERVREIVRFLAQKNLLDINLIIDKASNDKTIFESNKALLTIET